MNAQPEQLFKLGRTEPGFIGFDLGYLMGAECALRECEVLELCVQSEPGVVAMGLEMDEWAGIRERDL